MGREYRSSTLRTKTSLSRISHCVRESASDCRSPARPPLVTVLRSRPCTPTPAHTSCSISHHPLKMPDLKLLVLEDQDDYIESNYQAPVRDYMRRGVAN